MSQNSSSNGNPDARCWRRCPAASINSGIGQNELRLLLQPEVGLYRGHVYYYLFVFLFLLFLYFHIQ